MAQLEATILLLVLVATKVGYWTIHQKSLDNIGAGSALLLEDVYTQRCRAALC